MQKSENKINRFGANLKYMLSAKGWSQQLFADKMHISQQCISSWIIGNREPRLDDVLLVCYFLDEDPNEILGYNDLKSKDFDKVCKRLKRK